MGLMSSIGRGLSAAGYAAADMFSKQALEEQRAKLEEEKALRIADAVEARKAAPMQRFSGLMSAKMSEQVPQEAEPVTQSTSEGAKAAGLQDGLVGMTRDQVAAYKDPDMLAQFDRQMDEDKRLAAEKVAGKTRPRTQDEAIKAALNEALASDPQAFVAGHAMTASDQKEKLEERKIASKEKLEQMRIEQRDRSDDKRFEAMMTRIEALGMKDGSNKTALIQNAEYLKTLGYSPEKIEKFVFDKKEPSLEELAGKILSSDKVGDMTPEQAAQKAIGLRNAINAASESSKSPKLGTPKSGDVVDGFRFKGGNPKDQNSWAKVETATPVPAKTQPTSTNNASSGDDAQSRYLRALDELKQMRGGFLPTPESKKPAIREKEAEVNRLYNELYK